MSTKERILWHTEFKILRWHMKQQPISPAQRKGFVSPVAQQAPSEDFRVPRPPKFVGPTPLTLRQELARLAAEAEVLQPIDALGLTTIRQQEYSEQ